MRNLSHATLRLPARRAASGCALLVFLAAAGFARGAVTVYPAPAGIAASDDYTVKADGKPVFVYGAPVLRYGPASFTYFDFSGSVAVAVTSARKIESARVLPSALKIVPDLRGNVLTFTLTKPANLTIELNDGFDRPLHLFANPPEADRPNPADKSVLYFGPGVHEISTLRLKSGQTLYIAGGAVVRGIIPPDEKPVQEKNWKGNKVYVPLIASSRTTQVSIRGRGILDLGGLPWHARNALSLESVTGVLVEGIIVVDAPCWVVALHLSRDVTVRNVKQICARENSDGVDICNCQDVVVEDGFFRNNDDEVCVKTTSPPPAMESKNIVVRRCVVWNDRARGLGITNETRADISNVLFKDCDIIRDFAGGGDCCSLALLLSDAGTVHDIRFEDIRVEHCRKQLIVCWIGKDMWGHDEARGRIRGVVFRDIQVGGSTFPISRLEGFDETHRVEDVTVDRLRIQETWVDSAETGKFKIKEHVVGVRFLAAGR